MTEDKILELLDNKFQKALKHNEFYNFVVGLGDYLMIFKDSLYLDKNDPNFILWGLNYINKKYPNFNMEMYLDQQLIELISSDDIFKNYVALNFLVAYLFNKNRGKLNFEINVQIYSKLLKEKLNEQKLKYAKSKDSKLIELLNKINRDEFRFERDIQNKSL